MGVFIGSAVIPVALLLLWKKANAVGAMAGAIIGCVCGVITWLVVAQVMLLLAIQDAKGAHFSSASGMQDPTSSSHSFSYNQLPIVSVL
jgi:Na+/proline symporter